MIGNKKELSKSRYQNIVYMTNNYLNIYLTFVSITAIFSTKRVYNLVNVVGVYEL